MNKREVIQLLEALANTTHYDPNITTLLNKQPAQIREAFAENKPELLKAMVSEQRNFANETKVAEL